MPAPTNRDSDKFMLRFPDGMRDKIREAAETNGRSMNTEIIARLEGSFEAEPVDQRLSGILTKQQTMIDELMNTLREQGRLIDRLAGVENK